MRWTNMIALAVLVAAGCGQEPQQEDAAPQEAPPAMAPDPGDAPPAGPLGAAVAPTRYALHLRIDPREDRFSGVATIDLDLREPATRLWIHGQGLNVGEVFVERELTADDLANVIDADELDQLESLAEQPDLVVDPEAAPAADEPEIVAQSADQIQRIEAEYEQVLPSGVARVMLAEQLPAGAARLVIRYDAPFGRRGAGLYVVEENGARYALTNAAPRAARRIFPGFDEPGIAAPLELTLEVLDDDFAIANGMGVAREAMDEVWDVMTFLETPPIPMRNVAIAVGPYQFARWPNIPSNEVRLAPLPLGAAVTEGKVRQSVYGLENTGPITAALEAYFNARYPLEKLDLIAGPLAPLGGVGGPGVAIIAPEAFLVDADAPLGVRQALARRLGAGLARHWLDRAARPEWWSQSWMNDALAAQLGEKIAAPINRGAQLAQEGSPALGAALDRDELLSTQALGRSAIADYDAARAYDPFPAQKGARVLAMIEKHVGEEAYRAAVRRYADPDSGARGSVNSFLRLLSSETDAAGLEDIAGSFLDQPGAPVIDAELNCARANRPRVRLRQAPYQALGSRAATRSWRAPVCLRYEADGDEYETCAVLETREETVDLAGGSCPAFLFPNAGGAGYYRWTLGDAGWEALREHIGDLTPAETRSYVDSLDASLRSGALSPAVYLDHASSIFEGDNLLAIALFLDDVETLVARAFGGLQAGAALRDHIGALTAAQISRIQSSAAAPAEVILANVKMIGFVALSSRDLSMRASLRDAAAAYVGMNAAPDATVMDPELRRAAFSAGVQELGRPFVDRLFALAAETEKPSIRADIVAAFGAAETPDLAETVFERGAGGALSGDEFFEVLKSMMDGPARAAAWSYFTENADAILGRLSAAGAAHAPRIGEAFCDARNRDLLRALFQPRADAAPEMAPALEQTREMIDQCIALAEALASPMAAALEN